MNQNDIKNYIQSNLREGNSLRHIEELLQQKFQDNSYNLILEVFKKYPIADKNSFTFGKYFLLLAVIITLLLNIFFLVTLFLPDITFLTVDNPETPLFFLVAFILFFLINLGFIIYSFISILNDEYEGYFLFLMIALISALQGNLYYILVSVILLTTIYKRFTNIKEVFFNFHVPNSVKYYVIFYILQGLFLLITLLMMNTIRIT